MRLRNRIKKKLRANLSTKWDGNWVNNGCGFMSLNFNSFLEVHHREYIYKAHVYTDGTGSRVAILFHLQTISILPRGYKTNLHLYSSLRILYIYICAFIVYLNVCFARVFLLSNIYNNRISMRTI